MNKLLAVFVSVLGVYLCLPNVEGNIMCYSCDSGLNETCNDTSKTGMKTCNSTLCFKINYHSNTTGHDETFRGCTDDPLNSSLSCETYQSTFKVNHSFSNYKCFSCNSDHCNSAVTFVAPLAAMICALLATRMW